MLKYSPPSRKVSSAVFLPVHLYNGTILNTADYLADWFIGVALQQQKRQAIYHLDANTRGQFSKLLSVFFKLPVTRERGQQRLAGSPPP